MVKGVASIVSAFLVLMQGFVFCEEAAKTEDEAESPAEGTGAPLRASEYLVSSQDVLAVSVVGETDLTGLFEVSSKDGTIKYPYIEYVPVAGKTVKQIEELVTELLQDGWLVAPQVNVRVATYSEKLVYVGGQVNRPGKLSFSGKNEMTLYRAIVTAGGFTRIANMKKVVLMTTDDEGNPQRLEVNVSDVIKKPELDPPIKANDRIHVPERFF